MTTDNENEKVHQLPGSDDAPAAAAEIPEAALAALKNGKERIVGYILSPEVFVGILDTCEDIPFRYSKKIVPALQTCQKLIEDGDGNARVVNQT